MKEVSPLRAGGIFAKLMAHYIGEPIGAKMMTNQTASPKGAKSL